MVRTKWDYVGDSALAAWACCLLRDGRTVVLSTKDRPLAEEISAWHAQASISGADFPFATAETG